MSRPVLRFHEDGTFRMIDPETTTLRVTTHNGKSATCTITALPEPTAVYLDRTEITLRQTRSDVLYTGTREEITAATNRILDEAGTTGIILGADCTIPGDTP